MPCAVPETTAVTATASVKTDHPDSPPDAILGQLSTSIAEINQTTSAVVMNAEAALRMLRTQPTDTEAVWRLLACIVKDGMRTGDIVSRTRALIKKAPPERECLEEAVASPTDVAPD
jgi:hypothetical protein